MNRSQALYNVISIKVFHRKIVYAFNGIMVTKATLYHILLINSKKKIQKYEFYPWDKSTHITRIQKTMILHYSKFHSIKFFFEKKNLVDKNINNEKVIIK